MLARDGPEDVMTLAKVDVPTYTQRLIDDLKRHEDEFRKKQLESFSKNAELEVKDPFRVDYKVTKGELDPDILPDENALLQHTIEDLEKWNFKSDLKDRRSREIETVHVNTSKLKNEILTSTNLAPGELKKLQQDDSVV